MDRGCVPPRGTSRSVSNGVGQAEVFQGVEALRSRCG